MRNGKLSKNRAYRCTKIHKYGKIVLTFGAEWDYNITE